MSVKICCTSDVHGHLPDPNEIEPCDLLIIAGDICPVTNHDPHFQADWLKDVFQTWLNQIPAKNVFGIPGNHDFVFEYAPLIPTDLRWTWTKNGFANLCGIRLYGNAYTPWFHDWAFNAPKKDGELFLSKMYDQLDSHPVDIMVTHGPPLFACDELDNGICVGSEALRDRVLKSQPQYVICGHIHSGYGRSTLGETTVLNVARCTEEYKPTNPLVTFDIEI